MKKIVMLSLLSALSLAAFAKGLESIYPGDQGVTQVTDKKEKSQIVKKLDSPDVAFELGDGYYSTITTDLFKVRDGGRVVGYIERYFLSYTEDPEIAVVLVRYSASGKQVGEMESIGPLQTVEREDECHQNAIQSVQIFTFDKGDYYYDFPRNWDVSCKLAKNKQVHICTVHAMKGKGEAFDTYRVVSDNQCFDTYRVELIGEE